jgi:hypothetical protein
VTDTSDFLPPGAAGGDPGTLPDLRRDAVVEDLRVARSYL